MKKNLPNPFGSYAEFRASIQPELDKAPLPSFDYSYEKARLGSVPKETAPADRKRQEGRHRACWRK